LFKFFSKGFFDLIPGDNPHLYDQFFRLIMPSVFLKHFRKGIFSGFPEVNSTDPHADRQRDDHEGQSPFSPLLMVINPFWGEGPCRVKAL
jgi:hypothetical protein